MPTTSVGMAPMGFSLLEVILALATPISLARLPIQGSVATTLSPADAGVDIKIVIIKAMTLSHLDDQGRAQMVDVSAKADTERVAIAKGEVQLQASTLALIRAGKIEKGEVFSVARVAGIHNTANRDHPSL